MALNTEDNIILRMVDTTEANDTGEDQNMPPEEYWTEERMREAQPMQPVVNQSIWHAPQENVSSEPVTADVTVMPYECGGKLFFSDKAMKKNYQASAQFCGENQQVLLTAAH